MFSKHVASHEEKKIEHYSN